VEISFNLLNDINHYHTRNKMCYCFIVFGL